MNTILEAKDLCKTFSNEAVQQHVLRNLNLTIQEGDYTVIMGNSGSGKSTLLYALSGIDRPTLGEIFYRGETITQLSNDKLAVFRRKNCGFVFQQNYLNDTMSVMDNILVCGLLVKKDKKELVHRTEELVGKMGLSKEILRKFPTQLSGGEQQRIAIARAIAHTPKIVFADEPTGALDTDTGIKVMRLFKSLIEHEGVTIVMTTHDPNLMQLGDVVYEMEDGELVERIQNN